MDTKRGLSESTILEMDKVAFRPLFLKRGTKRRGHCKRKRKCNLKESIQQFHTLFYSFLNAFPLMSSSTYREASVSSLDRTKLERNLTSTNDLWTEKASDGKGISAIQSAI